MRRSICAGNDSLSGDAGNDTLFTGADDVINTANGGDGDDLIQFNGAGVGVYTIAGDAGIDTCKCKDFEPNCENTH